MFTCQRNTAMGMGLLFVALVVGAAAISWPKPSPAQKRAAPLIAAAALASPSVPELRRPSEPGNFRQVRLGQHKADVRMLLGHPTSVTSYVIKDEEVWSWPFVEASEHCTFSVIFSEDDVVIWTGTSLSEGVDSPSGEPHAPERKEPSY